MSEDRSIELRAVAITLWTLAATATALRVYVRVGIMKAFSLDDWIMMIAMISYTANSATSIAGTVYGSGRHMADLETADALTAMMWWWACYPSFAVTMIASKYSVGFFLLRITTQKLHRWIIYFAMAFTAASGIAFFFVAVFQCNPVGKAWNPTLPGTCLSVDALITVTYAYSSFAIVTDFTFTLLPAWLVWHLQMDKKTKIVLIPILSMACIASSAVAVRLAYLDGFRSADFLWATTDIAIWSQTEQGLAIAAGSFATLRPLFRIILSKLGFSSNESSATGGRGTGGPIYKGSSYANGSRYSSKPRHSMAKGSGPRSLFSMSTFTKMGDDEEAVLSDLDSPSSEHESSMQKGGNEYRVKIVSRGVSEAMDLPVMGKNGSGNASDSDHHLKIQCSREYGYNAV